MIYPILINCVEHKDGKSNIVASVIDFHPSQISRMVRQRDNSTVLIVPDGSFIHVMIPFMEAVKLYNSMQHIDKSYEDDVLNYYKDNFKGDKDGA